MSARLLFRVDPVRGESPRGYLCRVAHEHCYCGPISLAQIAGLQAAGLDREDTIKQLSYVLRLEPEEWRAMCYRHIKERNKFTQRLFYGEKISTDDLNYKRPRICPQCLREHPVWWAVWDLGLVTACPRHRCLLINQCPDCKRRLAWQRPSVHRCRCGLDLRDLTAEAATSDLVAINAAIYWATGTALDKAVHLDLTACGFPAKMLGLRLGSLLRLIVFIGSIKEKNGLRQKQRPFRATDLTTASEIDHAAVAALRDWPRPIREVLRCMLPPETKNPSALSFSAIFGNFYRHLFRVLPRNEFGFLHDAFERFVIEDWKGLIRGQHRYFSATVRRSAQWITANQAQRLACTAGGRILELVHKGHVESMVLKLPRGESRAEYWIRRESLNHWIAARDAELACYMPRPEAKRALGLTNCTMVKVAAAGAMRYVEGPEQNFPAGRIFFLREDVMRIKDAFEKHSVPMRAYSKPGEFLALRHAMKNYLGRESGLAAVIGAVIAGDLTPVGYTRRFRGITGYLFLSDELRKYRPVPDIKAPPEGFLNYREAAAVLGIQKPIIRRLVMQGLVGGPVGHRSGVSKLLSAVDVQRFAECYVAISVLARRFGHNSGSLARYLRESGTPLLAIPLLDAGKGHAFFLRKDVAARIQIPSRRMLREAARRRIVAAKEQRWAKIRQARETALGKPLRRVRANFRPSGDSWK